MEQSPWHSLSAADVLSRLDVDSTRGLSSDEAASRLHRLGPNRLAPERPEPWWSDALEALTEPLVLLLVVVGVAYALLGQVEDALTILIVILAVACVEVINESRAKRAIASLRELSAPRARVVRGGEPTELPTTDLVPGDLVLLLPGERVPADLRLIDAVGLRIDESSLTGEAVPSEKSAEMILPAETELADRRNLAFAGTVVSAGKGRGVVVATGPYTELGRIGRLAETAREQRTPLQEYLGELSRVFVWVALGISLLVPILGVLVARRPVQEMLLTSLTLAFATIPEELPILSTIVLGIGAFQLARRHAIVKHLRAAEALGSVSAIGTDKTGTLTENRLRVVEIRSGGWTGLETERQQGDRAKRLLEIGILASDALIGGDAGAAGDPTDIALLTAARDSGLDPTRVRGEWTVIREYPFDTARKRMSAVVERDGERWLVTKGAPETVVSRCCRLLGPSGTDLLEDQTREEIHSTIDDMARRGLRVLAFAERRLLASERLDGEVIETDLTLVGLVGLEDPPRLEVPDAVATLQRAGVRVLMLTGDHPATARAIAERVHIDATRVVVGHEVEHTTDEQLGALLESVSVFARIAPEHKVRIVRALQRQGQFVAVTGDGVNDAPALREAAIGVAMGRTGTDVAREAADLVLADDNFATVASAVRVGRALHANLRKAVRFYLAAKVALVSCSLVAVLSQLPVPFAPVQIIVMELFMDLGASTTFVAEAPENDVMARPPRDPRRPFLDGQMRRDVLAGGITLALAVIGVYGLAWTRGLDAATAQSAAFVTWMLGHVVLAAHMRSERQSIWTTLKSSNLPFLCWAGGVVALLGLGLIVPGIQRRLHVTTLPAAIWVAAMLAAVAMPAWWEVAKRVAWWNADEKPFVVMARSGEDRPSTASYRRPRTRR